MDTALPTEHSDHAIFCSGTPLPETFHSSLYCVYYTDVCRYVDVDTATTHQHVRVLPADVLTDNLTFAIRNFHCL